MTATCLQVGAGQLALAEVQAYLELQGRSTAGAATPRPALREGIRQGNGGAIQEIDRCEPLQQRNDHRLRAHNLAHDGP